MSPKRSCDCEASDIICNRTVGLFRIFSQRKCNRSTLVNKHLQPVFNHVDLLPTFITTVHLNTIIYLENITSEFFKFSMDYSATAENLQFGVRQSDTTQCLFRENISTQELILNKTKKSFSRRATMNHC